MRTLLPALAFVALTASRSGASCDLSVDAPAEIADSVALWSSTQVSCTPGFRAVASVGEDGIRLSAQDATHHWNRLVADGRTAAALIASWAVPDELAAHPIPVVARIADIPPLNVEQAIGMEIGVSVAGTPNVTGISVAEPGAGFAASLDIGRRWWRVGGAAVFLRDRSAAYVRAVGSVYFAGRHQLGPFEIMSQLGVGRLYARTFEMTESTTVIELGVGARLRLADRVAVSIDIDVFVPARSSPEPRGWLPVLGVGCEVAL